MLDQGVVRVEENQVHERRVGARGREAKLVVHLHHLQVLLPIIPTARRSEKAKRSIHGSNRKKISINILTTLLNITGMH